MRALWSSPALRVTLAMGVAGAAFAVGNILLARALPAAEYALVALSLALLQLAMPLGPLGADGAINRRHLQAGPRMLGRVLFTSALVCAVIAAIGGIGYRLPAVLLLIMFACGVLGALTTVAGASYQSRQRFGEALSQTQAQNYSLATAGILTAVLGVRQAWFPCIVFAIGLAIAAVAGWTKLFRERRGVAEPEALFGWTEGLAIVGVSVGIIALIQLERLVIPGLLGLGDLATYAVLASIAGSPYRMLQQGVGYTMLPHLRAAATVSERRRLVAREGAVALAAVAAASVVVWFATPIVVRVLLSGKYDLPPRLILAALVTGTLKVGSAFPSAAIIALGETRRVAWLNAAAWLSVGVAVVAATLCARWGLTGVIYGVGAGWLAYGLVGAVLAAPSFRPHIESM
jgi:O-antigen/teichoic acid export membrane protein